jgi:hypothetical protein
VLAESASPIVVHADADDVVLPGALAAMAEAVRDAPGVGQAFCDFESIGADGRVDAAEREMLDRFRATRPDGSHHRDLVIYGMVVNTLRTYRRGALEAVGPFDETLPYAVDYQMALRLADRFAFRRVPRVLYRRRVHGANVTAGGRFPALRFWWMRARICRRLAASGRVRFLRERPLRTAFWLAAGLADAAGFSRRPAPARLRTP